MYLPLSWFVVALVCCLTTRVVTPQGTEPETDRLSISTDSYKKISQSTDETVIAVSDYETIVKTNDIIYLLESAEPDKETTIVLAERHLHTEPIDVQAVSFEGTVYVTANHGSEVHLYKYRRKASKHGLHRVNYRLPDYYAYPPSSNATVSIHIRDEIYLHIYMVYYSETNDIISYDIHTTIQRQFPYLPSDCSCNHPQPLSSTYNYEGQAIVNCADGKRYLFNIYEDELFLMPKWVQHFVTSNNDRKSAVAVMHFEGVNQDILFVLNFRDDNEKPMTAAIPHHVGIQDIAIAPVNNSDKELVYILNRNNTLEYFVLQDNVKSPVLNTLSLPPNVTIKRFVGVTKSSLAILVTSYNQTFITLARAVLSDQVIEQKNTNMMIETVQPTLTISILNENNSIQPTRMSANQTIIVAPSSESVQSMTNTKIIVTPTELPATTIPTELPSTTIPTELPSTNTPTVKTSSREDNHEGPEIALIIVATVFLVLIILFIVFTLRKCNNTK